MDIRKCTSSSDARVLSKARFTFTNKVHLKAKVDGRERPTDPVNEIGADIDLREVYFLIMHFLSSGPCQQTCEQLRNELMQHQLLPRRYHAGIPRNAVHSGDDNGISSPLSYSELVERYPHIEKDHLVKLLKQLILSTTSPLNGKVGRNSPSAADVPTLLGTGSFSLLDTGEKNAEHKHVKPLPAYMRWPHTQVDQVRGLSLREIGGGFTKHHRAPSLRSACYVVAKPSTMVQKMETTKLLRGHRDAVYCAIFDRSGRYVITGSDDRLVKIWSMDTALCLTSCRGHEGDITDLAVSSNNDMVASAANDFVIRVWRLPDGLPIAVFQGHIGAVTAIAFSPRNCYNLLSSSDDGTCRIWDVRNSQRPPRIYVPKPADAIAGRSSGALSNGTSSTNALQSRQILCCAYNAMGTVFVTGSSDTYARVWDACRSKTVEPGQPIHEMDILSGHENDVNYVQFSGCAVVSRSDTPKDNISSKDSLFFHDNIVTCSRDGSAIIWVPRMRRCHGKAERGWTRAYHLKVPPPPLLPQRPRGGPRQRLLPTPRGVNMIVWSLDNRFVLAAIMDCRICVWNAIDGGLVHSLTGHRASSYVLDVHPFNPRIAMSAGYDGLTIVWDIWEGTPIRIFEVGGYKLVDGKFSPDGTSIVLSDDVGQIYLISTGQGESYKDAKYDQFFLGDYRPLIRDDNGNVVDQETQLAPYRRNGLDLLSDSSMIPYPEPYQSMYQQRRFGALCKTWNPSSMKFAIGLDISLDHNYEMPPLADLQRMIEPIPEFLDAMYLEPENEVMSDSNDSEYNVPEELCSEGEQGGISASSFSDSECSTEDSDVEHSNKDALRRSSRKNHSTEIESMTSSKRRTKKRNLEERAGTTSRSNRTKRSKCVRRAVSKIKSSKAKTVRPQRVAALNALNMFAQSSGTSVGEDEDDSEDSSSDSESVLQDSNIQIIESDKELQNRQWKFIKEECPPLQLEDVPKHPELPDSQSNIGNRKRLVFKFSLRDSKKPMPSGEIRPKCEDAVDLACPSFMSQETSERIEATSKDPRSSSADAIDMELSQTCNNDVNGIDMQNNTKATRELDVGKHKGLCFSDDAQKCTSLETLEPDDHRLTGPASTALSNGNLNKQYEDLPGSSSFRDHESLEKDKEIGTNNSYELKLNPPPKSTKLKIKIKSPSKLNFVHAVDSMTTASSAVSSSQMLHPEANMNRHDVHKRGKSHKARTNFDDLDVGMEGGASDAGNHFDSGMKLPETARRTRSMMGSTSREPSAVNHNVRGGYELRTSINADQITSEEGMSNSKLTVRSRSSRSGQGGYYDNSPNYSLQRESSHPSPKASWLMLSEIEEGYRYIPQLGDEVVYLRQGHQQYISTTNSASSDSPPWKLFKGKHIGAVEICKLEEIEYLVIQGSGDSGCKITLKFVDPVSSVYNESFKLTLPELVSTPDFVIERTLYDAAIERQWTVGDTCSVWWGNGEGNGTGTWWDGEIVSSNPKSPDFSDSPWERYVVRYTDGNETQHSPWELHDADDQFQWPQIDSESIDKLLNLFAKLKESASKNQDRYGFQKLNQVAQRSEFINSFPVPLYPEVIRLRLTNKYYRTMEAVKHDIKVMLANAEKYFERSTELSSKSKVKRLSGWFRKKLSKFS